MSFKLILYGGANALCNKYLIFYLGEEKSLHSKMLLKLRGTFKVRLFQGSDWPQSDSGSTNKHDDCDNSGRSGKHVLSVCNLWYSA